ncbi:hypothetical protein P4U23_11995 [Aeribacillus composti]|uniref:AIR synthase related protein n=1 Tax=Aeribacillus composti TaxID=1868734 RepID=UPI002E2105D1|nr:hypothetical protein [Aeribacillus composti]
MRDVIMIPISNDEDLVIAADNSGGVGQKLFDYVKVDYETVAYYGLRVVLSECLTVGAKPLAIVMQNLIGEEEWSHLQKGCQTLFSELKCEPIPITGSTESNFKMVQSAFAIMVIGKVRRADIKVRKTPSHAKFACIGKPLCGGEVIEKKHEIGPLPIIKKLLELPYVFEIVPIGSKGIQYEWKKLCEENKLDYCQITSTEIDITKSAGPATCFLISFDPSRMEDIAKMAGGHFFLLNTK